MACGSCEPVGERDHREAMVVYAVTYPEGVQRIGSSYQLVIGPLGKDEIAELKRDIADEVAHLSVHPEHVQIVNVIFFEK